MYFHGVCAATGRVPRGLPVSAGRLNTRDSAMGVGVVRTPDPLAGAVWQPWAWSPCCAKDPGRIRTIAGWTFAPSWVICGIDTMHIQINHEGLHVGEDTVMRMAKIIQFHFLYLIPYSFSSHANTNAQHPK